MGGLMRQQQRLQKRLEKVSATKAQLAGERAGIAALRATECIECTNTVAEAKLRAAAGEVALVERREELEHAINEVERLREAVRTYQGNLEPIQKDLQTKEAELKER